MASASRTAFLAPLARLDERIRRRRRAIGVISGLSPAMALTLVIGIQLVWATSPLRGAAQEHDVIRAARSAYENVRLWSLEPAQVLAVALGASALLVTLYIATALGSIEQLRPEHLGTAHRIVLDDVTTVSCLLGSLSCWVLALAAPWHGSTVLAWATPAACGLLLSALASCAEHRDVVTAYRRWKLRRAAAELRVERCSTADDSRRSSDSFRTVVPWSVLVWFTLAVLGPTAATAMAAAPQWWEWWLAVHVAAGLASGSLVLATWSLRTWMRGHRIRTGRRITLDAISYTFFTLLGGAIVLAAVFVAESWAAWVSFALLIAACGLPSRRGLLRGLYRRRLDRELACVRAERAAIAQQAPPEAATPPTCSHGATMAPATTSWRLGIGPITMSRTRATHGGDD